MSHLGIGVMLCRLFGDGREGKPLEINRKIASLAIADDVLTVRFEGGGGYRFKDDGQSCCESRYMRSDDKPEDFVGATFMGAEIAPAPDGESEYGEPHDIEFLRILTDRGPFVASNHNEHNGYYGGFCIHVDPVTP